MIKITTQQAVLGMNYKLPSIALDKEEPLPQVQIKDPQVRIRAEAALVEIDQTRCFEETGYYKPRPLGQKMYNDSKAKTLQAIGKIASDGDQLAQVEKNPQAIATIAQRDFNRTKEYNVTVIPKSPPEITVHKGNLDISLEEGSVNIEKVRWSVTVTPASEAINIYLQQKPDLNIEYLGSRVDLVK